MVEARGNQESGPLVAGPKGKMVMESIIKAMHGNDGDLHQAARIACEGLTDFAARMAQEAERSAAEEKDTVRAEELKEIARICYKVPQEPAGTFHEALQSLWLTHMAVNFEGINSAISFGRMDQYLYPYYQQDLEGVECIESGKDVTAGGAMYNSSGIQRKAGWWYG